MSLYEFSTREREILRTRQTCPANFEKCPAKGFDLKRQWKMNERQCPANRCPAKTLNIRRTFYSDMSGDSSKCLGKYWGFAGRNVRRG